MAKKGKNGLNCYCRECAKKKTKDWAEKNKEKKKQSDKNYALKKADLLKEYQKKYREENKEKARIYSLIYREKNKQSLTEKRKVYFSSDSFRERRKDYLKERKSKDKKFRITCAVRSAVSEAVKNKYGSLRHMEWSIDELIIHLEKQFTKGMTWENYGKWHIDHIIPVCDFNYNDIEDIEFKRCWSLPNLRPLWASDNCSKQGKLTSLL